MVKINSALFSQYAVKDKNLCPECGSALVIKNGKHGRFRSCSNYPKCLFMQGFTNNDGHIIKALGLACPECGNELVLRQGRFGMFIGCSNYPDCQHIEKREKAEKAQQTHVDCPECQKGLLCEKQSRFGKRFYACDAYPKCTFAINFKPIFGKCAICGYPLLVEKHSANGVSIYCAAKKCQSKQV